MALISANSTKRLVPPHEPESWFDVRPITAGDMEHLAVDGSQVSVSIELMSTIIRAWSYDQPVSLETIRMLDLDTFVWLGQEVLVVSGVRDEAEKKSLERRLIAHISRPEAAGLPAEYGYLTEMAWLNAHGITSCYEDYLRLPLGVLQDCTALAWAEQTARRRQAAR